MGEQAWLTACFEEHRPRLRGVAYRMLGSLSEADDAVQDAWLRLNRADTSDVENLAGWLTTVVARVWLYMLRARATRREVSLGVHVPDPIVSRQGGGDPEHEALPVDSVGLALLVVLDSLTPAERLAFVLHDSFAVPFEEIAPMIERSPASARQLASRARRVRDAAPVPDPDLTRQREVVDAFSPPPVKGTSTRSSPCSIPTWSSGPMVVRPAPARASRSPAPGPWPSRPFPRPPNGSSRLCGQR